MTKISKTDEITYNTNLSQNQTRLFISRLQDSKQFWCDWKNKSDIHWSEYQIKETDMRVKTASFTTPQYLDLTNGQYAVLITSPIHEDFSGIILNDEYDNKTDLYTYQCQDWSRKYISKMNLNATGNAKLINILKNLVTLGKTSLPVPSQNDLNNYKNRLSGFRNAEDYDQSKWESIINFNPMNQTPYLYVRDKPGIEIIRDLVYGSGAYIDLYFNKYGILQFEPYNRTDFYNTGVTIDKREVSDFKLKFDTTNILTGVKVASNNEWEMPNLYTIDVLRDFFGENFGSVSNPNSKTESSNVKSTSSASNTSNPYGNKAKKIWINSDNGSGNMKNEIANLLKQKGWSVHVGGTCSNCHYSDYFNVTSDYQVYATLYNGFCAGTVREAYSSSIQNTLKKKGVVLVIMWDTSGWTNPNGMKPYRYGDFSGYNASRAWDDNFSSSDPSIKNVSDWLKKNNAIYCANPTADGIVNQFLAGGYFKSVGK